MKKVFLFLTMLLFAFVGVTRADEVEIGTDATTNNKVPTYTYYNYSLTQQIYTADEIGMGGYIKSISFKMSSGSSTTRNLNVFMRNVEKSAIASTSDWETFDAGDALFSGNVTFSTGWVTITFDRSFNYDGESNLLVCVQDVTGSYVTAPYFYVFTGQTNCSMYVYRDDSTYPINNPGTTGSRVSVKNHIKLVIEDLGPANLVATENPIEMGYRPNGAWMKPYTATFNNLGGYASVTAAESNNSFFTVNGEFPMNVEVMGTAQVEIGTATGTVGNQSGQIMLMYPDRGFTTVDVNATAYDPVASDVWETAETVTAMPYSGNAPAGIYKNYDLPGMNAAAKDAVYKVTFNEDVMFSAGNQGSNAVTALYNEDFDGVGGPDADNNYVYNGPSVNPGPMTMWFSYAYTGTNSFLGYSDNRGMYFGYKISAEIIADLGVADCSLVTVEAAAREAYPYDLIVVRGGENPSEGDIIYYQPMETAATPLYFFDMNLDEPFVIGDEDLWVLFYSESPYAAYTGTSPVSQDGKIFYSTNFSTWYSADQTPVIYCRLIELPTGREITMNLADVVLSGNETSSVAEAVNGEVKGVSKAQIYNELKAGNANSEETRASYSEPEYQIADMFVPAGTYYVAAASTDDNFQVNMKTSAIPAPEQSIVIAPYDGETDVNTPYIAEWILGDYTTEMQVLVGTQYPPQTALIDWTSELVESAAITDLANNQSYYIQVNERNSAGTTYGEVSAFITSIDPVEGFAVEDAELYPGDAAVFTWDANRTFKGYNIYMDGVKLNETLITEATYTVEGLEYNMDGYNFAVTAVYDAGESSLSDMITVYMTGNGTVSGTIYEIDSTTVIPFATVEFRGTDEYNNIQTITMTADENGAYSGEVLAGTFTPYAYKDGFAECPYSTAINIAYEDVIEDINIYVHEFYYPLGQIKATEQENDVLVEWAWTPAELVVDFETGDFSQAEFNNTVSSYPWIVTTTNPYEGTYCMKSTCEGIASGTSAIEVTTDVPFDGKMGFYVKLSSETNYDKFYFYIDGVQQGAALSGSANYSYKEFSVTEGTHTYKWEYTKDSSVNANDDCIYVDNIVMYRQDIPLPGGMTYDFDDGTMMGWTSIDADGDGYGWDPSSQPGNYHNSGVNLSGTGHNSSEAYVISGSFSNATGSPLNPNNYLVSPSKIAAQDGAYIRFYACAQDESYSAEHFGVAVSTGNATASDFTTVQEWTLTAKSVNTADNNRSMRGMRQGGWYEYTVDLSAYAGQEIWVAIRHFNCSDQFILNVDDITLGDGSRSVMAGNDRTFQSYNLYRRDNNAGGEPELIATPAADVFEYTDAAWNNLPYGVYQWGIQATYEGNAPVDRSREEITYNFDDGTMMSWTSIDADGDGYDWDPSSQPGSYFASGANLSGTGHNSSEAFVMSGSYTNVSYLALHPDNYLVSPVKAQYSQISFWACSQDASYPAEHFGVAVSTTDNTSASSFTTIQEWTMTAKGTSGVQSVGRNGETRAQGNWYEYTVDLSAYAGQEIWVAIRHFNCSDQFIFNVDDITLTTSSAPVPPVPPVVGGSGLSEILWSNEIEKDMYTSLTVNVALNNNQNPAGATLELAGANTYTATVDETGVIVLETVRKGEYELTLAMDGYVTITETVEFTNDEVTLSYVLEELVNPVEDLYVSPTGLATWAGGATPTPPTPPTPPTGDVTIILTVGDVWGDGSGYQMLLDADATAYGSIIPGTGPLSTNCSGNESIYAEFEYKIPTNADGNCSTSNIVINNSITITIPAGTYDWCITNPTPGDRIWIASENGNVGGRQNDYVFEGGKIYSFTVILGGSNDQTDVTISDGKSMVTPQYNVVAQGEGDVRYSENTRAALSYKVMLDGSFVGETTMAMYQHDTEGMEEGSEHVTAVAPIYASGMGDWMEYTWTYTSCSNYAGVTDLTATESGNDVLLTWTFGGTPTPPTPPTGGWTENFDNGQMPTGWATIDGGNPAGFGWQIGSVKVGAGNGHNGSADFVLSQSYDNTYGVVYPDNYLVTSQVTPVNGSTFSFWACAQDANYPAEHFGVAVSTGSQTNASDFTTIQEWTMTAKGTSGVEGIGRNGEIRAQGSWHQYTVDLSAYAGQNIYIAIRHFNCSDCFYLNVDDVEFTTSSKAIASGRAMWDEIATITCSSGYQYGVTTDGTNIYTSTWSSSADAMFYKYDMSGNFIESFNISGCGYCRDITYDGQYFYGVANSSTVYCLDLVNKTLVSSFSTPYGAMRCITYDSQRDGFWVVGNWSGNLTLIDRTGAIQQVGPAPTSASGIGFYSNSNGEDHVLLNCQPTGAGSDRIDDYNITTGAFTEGVHNIVTTATGSSGGMHVGDYNGTLACYASCQESPNIIHVLELEGTPTPPVPPTPQGDILGVLIYRDGELITSAPVAGTTYTDEGAAGASEYCVRVVYDDYATACPVCAEVTATACDPVENLAGVQYNNQGTEGVLLTWDAPAGAISYNIYQIVDGTAYLLGNLSGDAAFISGIEQSGTYTFGVTAVYANCESDMETVSVDYIIGVEENEIVNAIYPNPTSSDLHINATAMTRVSVYNAMGQMVYDQAVDSDEIIINMGQFEAGVYMVNVVTENGSTVKRITVVK